VTGGPAAAAPESCPAAASGADVTEDRLLGGRVRLRQPRRGGLRAGIDPVLLAAAVPARPGELVLEAGCGGGAAFLCLAARVPGVVVRAVERDPALAALAAENAMANGLGPERAEVLVGEVRDRALARAGPRAAHAFANPPWWPGGTPPPEPRRRAATHEDGAAAAGLEAWTGFLAAGLAPGGSLTLVLPAALFDRGLAALAAAGCGSARLFPLWPRAGEAAKRVLLQGRLGHRGPARVEAGLVLHAAEGAGGFTPAAEAVLRDAAALPWG
jgi:tRNA1Val (adenine37-N6)-methyltransferase